MQKQTRKKCEGRGKVSFLSKLRRGFTITELVIVIAVVAILAAVLIPTFTNIVNKANESADTQLVKNLNTILSSEQTVSQEAAPTMSKALEQAQSGGYTVDKLTPTSDGDILWEQDSNRFVLVSGGEIIFKDSTTKADISKESYKFWKITNVENEAKTGNYSYYLGGESFTGADLGTVTHGIDVGKNTNVTINYATSATQSVIFNTNGGTLTVNAANSDVEHYGASDSVLIEAVASRSYYLYATIASTVEIQSGRLYVGQEATVPTVNAMPKAGNVIIDGDASATIGNIFVPANQEGITISSSIESNTQVGSPTADTELFDGGNGTQQSPYLIATAEQFMAINQLSSPSYYFRLVANIDLTGQTADSGAYIRYFSNAELDGANQVITINSDLFSRFNGSVLKNVTIVMNGDDLHITGADYAAECLFENVTLSGSVHFTGRNQGLFVCYGGDGNVSAAETITFRNCVNNVTVTGVGGTSDYNAIFVGYSWGPLDLVFEDCINNGSLTCGQAALFLGNQSSGSWHVNMTITNFVNNGNIITTNAKSTYNQYIASPDHDYQTITVDGTQIDSLQEGHWSNISQVVEDAKLNITLNKDGTFEVTAAAATNVVSYRITYGEYFSWWEQEVDEEGNLVVDGEGNPVYRTAGTQVYYITEDFSKDDFEGSVYTSTIKWLDYVTKNYVTGQPTTQLGDYDVVTIGGQQYYVVENDMYKLQPVEKAENGSEEGIKQAPKDITIVAYDANGTIVATKTITVA